MLQSSNMLGWYLPLLSFYSNEPAERTGRFMSGRCFNGRCEMRLCLVGDANCEDKLRLRSGSCLSNTEGTQCLGISLTSWALSYVAA